MSARDNFTFPAQIKALQLAVGTLRLEIDMLRRQNLILASDALALRERVLTLEKRCAAR